MTRGAKVSTTKYPLPTLTSPTRWYLTLYTEHETFVEQQLAENPKWAKLKDDEYAFAFEPSSNFSKSTRLRKSAVCHNEDKISNVRVVFKRTEQQHSTDRYVYLLEKRLKYVSKQKEEAERERDEGIAAARSQRDHAVRELRKIKEICFELGTSEDL